MKNIVLILFFLILLATLAYVVFFSTDKRIDLHYPLETAEPCQENLTRSCQVGNCTGVSVCKNGNWGSCRLNLVCEPGSRIACSESGCVQGFRVCDECGSGYGPCR